MNEVELKQAYSFLSVHNLVSSYLVNTATGSMMVKLTPGVRDGGPSLGRTAGKSVDQCPVEHPVVNTTAIEAPPVVRSYACYGHVGLLRSRYERAGHTDL